MRKTITALATPPGIGGIAVIRISGQNAFEIADKVFSGKNKIKNTESHRILYGTIIDEDELIDTVTASVFRSPNSYTGEDTVEISCHGGMIVSSRIISIIIKNGAVLAEPGEFTKRSFLNGKLDLTQVEAVADIIHSVSVPGTQTAARQLTGEFTNRLKITRKELLDISALLELELDFSEEGLEFIPKETIINKIDNAIKFCKDLIDSYQSSEILRSGYFVGIAGYPNSGKSTLFNTLLGRNRAIVSDIAGTTRDYIEETIHINGIAVRIIDTAGIRESKDIIEIEGIKLVNSVLEQSNLIIILNDLTEGIANSQDLYQNIKQKYPTSKVIIVHNKKDLLDYNKEEFAISATTKEGIERLKEIIHNEAINSIDRISDIMVNQRHSSVLYNTIESLKRAKESIVNNMENEVISIDIRIATKQLGELTGEEWNEEVLAHIFSSFCIGK